MTDALIIPFIYDSALYFSEGKAAVAINKKWGFINKNGNIAVPCVYDSAKSFSAGMAAVEMDKKWVFVNKNAELIIPCVFDSTNSFLKKWLPLKWIRNGFLSIKMLN